MNEAKNQMDEQLKQQLKDAARVNLGLNSREYDEFIRLINGRYSNDEDACRGYIWDCIEEDYLEED